MKPLFAAKPKGRSLLKIIDQQLPVDMRAWGGRPRKLEQKTKYEDFFVTIEIMVQNVCGNRLSFFGLALPPLFGLVWFID